MDEIASKAFNTVTLKQNSKGMVKRGALSVINGDINTRKRTNNSRNLNCKPQQENSTNPDIPQKFSAFINDDATVMKKLTYKTQKQSNSEHNPHAHNAKICPALVCVNVTKLKGNCQLQKQEKLENKPHIFDSQPFSDVDQDGDVVDLTTEKNYLPSTSNDVHSSDEELSVNLLRAEKSSVRLIECDEISSVVKKHLVSLHNKKNNERPITEFIWCTLYRDDIHNYLKIIEKNFRPNPNYMEKQSDITMNMRSVLIDWFVEVGQEYKLQAETLFLAVSYVDRFLSLMSVLRGKLQLVGTASMFLAAKHEEIYPPELKDFVYITDDTYSKKQILRMEHLILKVLNFDVSGPTAYTFLQLYCSMCNASDVVMHLSQYICELSLLDGNPFLKFTPSSIAAGSLALANYTLGFVMWDEAIVASSGYKLTDLMHIILCLYDKYSSMSICAHRAIYDKYKALKYNAVSTIPQPANLIFPEI